LRGVLLLLQNILRGSCFKKTTHGLEGDPDDTKQLIDLRTGPDVIKQLVDLRGVILLKE
jgi:hypothetical protein